MKTGKYAGSNRVKWICIDLIFVCARSYINADARVHSCICVYSQLFLFVCQRRRSGGNGNGEGLELYRCTVL